MNNKKTFFSLLVATGALVISAFAFATLKEDGSSKGFKVQGDSNFTTTLSSSNRPAELLESFQNNFKGDVKTAKGNDINLSFVNARSYEGLFAQIAGHGKIYNYADGNSEMRGIQGVTLEGQGTLLFKPVIPYGSNHAAIYPEIEPIAIAAGAGKVDVPLCNYFELEAADGGVAIQNLTFTYSCDEDAIPDVKLLNGTYTGVGSDGSTWKIVALDGNVSIASLDKQSQNLSFNGSVTMLSKTQAKCTFVYMSQYHIYYTMNYDGHSLTFVEKTDDAGGAIAAQVATINFNRVYNVENFESYTLEGQGYTNTTTKYQTTGLRAAYFADYYTGGGSDEIRGSGWQVMTSTDNMKYRSTGGHNNSKMATFKFSNGTSMSYLSMNEVYGVKHILGKGTKISFWTRGAFKDINFNEYSDYDKDVDAKLYVYYKSPLIASEQETYAAEEFLFTVHQGTAWEQHEFSLNGSGRAYYGFGLKFKQSTGAAVYIPIDDVEIYTADPRAVYTAVTGVALNKSSTEITVGQTETLVATLAPEKATNKNVTWQSSNTEVATVDAQGVVTAVKAGSATITVTTVEGSFTDTCNVTVNPAVLLDYPEGTYVALATINDSTWKLALAIGNATNGLINVRVSNKDMGATGITYDQQTKAITIPTAGSFEAEILGQKQTISIGTVTGVYDPDHCKIINIHVGGTIENFVTNNGNLEATMPQTYYDCDGTTAELQATFKRRYMSGGWQVDTGNTNRYERDTEHFVSGTGAMKRKGWTGGAVSTVLNADFNPARSLENIGFWVYNPTNNKLTIRQWIFQATNLGSNSEIGEVYAEPNTWTYCVMGFGQKSIYNFQIADFTNSGAAFTFDNIVLF